MSIQKSITLRKRSGDKMNVLYPSALAQDRSNISRRIVLKVFSLLSMEASGRILAVFALTKRHGLKATAAPRVKHHHCIDHL